MAIQQGIEFKSDIFYQRTSGTKIRLIGCYVKKMILKWFGKNPILFNNINELILFNKTNLMV
ncbi:MAG: hypothetical protein A2X61_12690 [Ignavibacteria bacterium GWB2_35_12]|nr:MAG: hypothetical protein A2X61_12690 [Ignavibacteria bacterium GWB2_35_12]OGU91379.1 MAG: hypothetical protein A2220_08505 [Ignavibacteria bacterium RIFOXYA2_FULL_35_10]